MNEVWVIADPETGAPIKPRGWGSRGLYVYRKRSTARQVASSMGLPYEYVVRFTPDSKESA